MLAQLALAGAHVDVVDGAGSRQRSVRVAQPLGALLGIRRERGRVRRLVGTNERLLSTAPGLDADPLESLASLGDDQIVVEEREATDVDIVRMRHDLLPRGLGSGAAVRQFHQPEVRRVEVGPDDPAPPDVVRVVLESALAGRQYRERAVGRIRREEPGLVRHRAAQTDRDVRIIPGLADPHVEARVGLFVNDLVLIRVLAEDVLLDRLRQQRDRIVLDIEQRPVVIRPGHRRRGPGHRVRQELAGAQVLDPDRVLAPADLVHAERQEIPVRADPVRADLEVVLALCHLVDVQQDLFRSPKRAGFSAVDRVLEPFLEPRVVVVPPIAIGNTRVILLHPPDDFLEDPVLETPNRCEHDVAVGVLGFEIGQHGRILARVVAQPVILVRPRPVRGRHVVGALLGLRGHRTGGVHRRAPVPG